MADTPEAVASRLDQFVDAATKKVPSARFPNQVGIRPKPPTVKDVYADCLRQLTDQEREAFARTLEKIRAAL